MQRQEPVQQASEEPVRQVLPEPIVQEPERQALPEQLEQARELQASVPEPIEPGLDLQPEREQRA